jgi:hypothetical protein
MDCLKWSRYADSNRRPTHYECVALPTELYRLVRFERALKRPWTFRKASLDVSKSGAQRYASASYRLRLAQEFCHFDFAGRVAGLEELLACDLIG